MKARIAAVYLCNVFIHLLCSFSQPGWMVLSRQNYLLQCLSVAVCTAARGMQQGYWAPVTIGEKEAEN